MPSAPTKCDTFASSAASPVPVAADRRGRSGRGRICFVAHSAYGEMAGGTHGEIGGIQRQQSLMARWLAARGWDVSMLTWDEGQPAEIFHDGVRVIRLCHREAGLRGLRFVHPRWTSLCSGMKRADAELYYHNSAEYVTGQVAHWCRRHGRCFVYSAASDPACDVRLPTLRTVRERVLYRYGIRQADGRIVQTRRQQQALLDGFGLASIVLPMPCCEPASERDALRAEPSQPPRVVWVGRISPEKRLGRLLEIARAMPEIRFEVAGRPAGGCGEVQQELARAATMPNVRLLGSISREQIFGVYRGALCLCNTSSYEGFPNTFLEAWSLGIPVVATVDPDDTIQREGLGAGSQSCEGLVAAIRSLMDRGRWDAVSARCRSYFVARHSVDAAMERFERYFLERIPRQPLCAAQGVPA